MKKTWSWLLSLVLLLAVGGSLLGGCAGRTAQQKKTSWYKHHSGGKAVPCPCGH